MLMLANVESGILVIFVVCINMTSHVCINYFL